MINSSTPKDKDWMIKCRLTLKQHIEYKRKNENWTVRDTAISLGRSKSAIAQEIMIANWLKTHEAEMRRYSYLHDVLEFVRKRKRQLELEELEND